MRIGICDDLSGHRDHLVLLLDEYCAGKGLAAQIDEFESGEELLDAWTPGAYQILFLDVYMDGMSGVEAARRIREKDQACAIIFTTTSEEHAMAGYEVRASDYLVKPYGAEELAQAMDWCLEEQARDLRELDVVSGRAKLQVPLREILYAEVYGRVCVIHTAGEKISTNMSLTELEELVSGGDFLRCHRSYLVNMNGILRPEEGGFRMVNGDSVPVGADNAVKIRQTFFDWSFRRTWEGR